MKKIIFNKVTIKNFLSIGKTQVSLDFKSGITLITGENLDKGGRNGVGKSSLIEAIYWCLFGNTIRDIKKDKVLHNQSKKGCEVVLNFNVHNGQDESSFRITRTLEPSKLVLENITDTETKDISLSSMPKTDEYIKELIGANEEVFQNSVIMTANGTIPFMAQKKIDKRKFIEGILDLSIFSEMLLKVRADYNEKKKENDLMAKDFSHETHVLGMLEATKQNFDENKTKRIDNIKDKIKVAKDSLQNLKAKNIPDVSSLREQIKALKDKNEELREDLKDSNKKSVDIGKEKSGYSDKINQAKREKQKILDKGNVCPTCNREYCEEDVSYIKSEIDKLDKIIENTTPLYTETVKREEKIHKKGTDIQEKIDNNKDKISDIEETISDASLHHQKIKTAEEKIEEYKSNIEEIEQEIFNDDSKIVASENKIKTLEKDLSDLQKRLLILENAKFVVSEEGVKTFIVKKMLNALNSQLNYYLKALDAPCTCVFDETFEETIYNDGGKECSYFNFSGGERKRIDVAVLLMFQDILRCQSGTSFNLNMYDELLDTGLDDKGIEKVLDILREKVTKQNDAIYIVSHKATAKSNIDEVIFLKKDNGVTSIAS